MTVATAMSLLMECTESVFGWMRLIFVRFDAWGWVLGALGIFTVYRFLLRPFLGGAVSFGDRGGNKGGSKSHDDSKGQESGE